MRLPAPGRACARGGCQGRARGRRGAPYPAEGGPQGLDEDVACALERKRFVRSSARRRPCTRAPSSGSHPRQPCRTLQNDARRPPAAQGSGIRGKPPFHDARGSTISDGASWRRRGLFLLNCVSFVGLLGLVASVLGSGVVASSIASCSSAAPSFCPGRSWVLERADRPVPDCARSCRPRRRRAVRRPGRRSDPNRHGHRDAAAKRRSGTGFGAA